MISLIKRKHFLHPPLPFSIDLTGGVEEETHLNSVFKDILILYKNPTVHENNIFVHNINGDK